VLFLGFDVYETWVLKKGELFDSWSSWNKLILMCFFVEPKEFCELEPMDLHLDLACEISECIVKK
jgi:hypothetical protein